MDFLEPTMSRPSYPSAQASIQLRAQPRVRPAGRRLLALLCLSGAFISLSGCALITPVQPWERGTLARQEMTFETDTLDGKFMEHIYSSKEAAAGGAGVGGGGCGCN